jgi:hypothetical protein
MSVTQLLEIEACPRRWALNHAAYSGLWSRRGYPPKLSKGGLRGQVVHRAIQSIIGALARAGCPSVSDAQFTETLRGMGGYSQVLRESIEHILNDQSPNPRFARAAHPLERWITEQVPTLRLSVQEFMSQVKLQARESSRALERAHVTENGFLPGGSYAEVVLRHPGIHWLGIVDLLTVGRGGCQIVDFKTGGPKPEYSFQLQVYSLLWMRDKRRNPEGQPVSDLIVSYANREEHIPPLGAEDLAQFEQTLLERTRSAATDASAVPAVARPSTETCRFCTVRHLCSTYWHPDVQQRLGAEITKDGPPGQSFLDLELDIGEKQGSRTWHSEVVSGSLSPGTLVTVCLSPHDRVAESVLERSNRVRLVSGWVEQQNLADQPVIGVSLLSELFEVQHR